MEPGISNVYIDSVLCEYADNFMGTFSSNEVEDKMLKVGQSLVINLSPVDKPGSHFVAAKAVSSKELCFFDSLQLSQIPFAILNFLRNQRKSVTTLNWRIQHYESSFCGFFCIAFVLSLQFVSFSIFVSYFQKNDLLLNDYIVIEMIRMLLQIKYILKYLCTKFIFSKYIMH